MNSHKSRQESHPVEIFARLPHPHIFVLSFVVNLSVDLIKYLIHSFVIFLFFAEHLHWRHQENLQFQFNNFYFDHVFAPPLYDL